MSPYLRPRWAPGWGRWNRARLRALRSKAVTGAVTGWAGPWAHDVRWWDPDAHERCARYQLLVGEPEEVQTAVIAVVENGRAAIEAIYD